MRPLTDTVPKPLLKAGGKPLIVWHLERCASWGVKRVVINHAHLGAQLEQTLGNGAAWGLDIVWSPEGEALETAGGIAQALPLLGPHPFLVVNGDVFCDWQAHDVVRGRRILRDRGLLAYLWLVNNPEHRPQGDFTWLADGHLLPQPEPERGMPLTFSGLGLYDPVLFAPCIRGQKAPLAPLLRAAMEADRVQGEPLPGLWVDVGTPQRLAQLDARLQAVSGEVK